MKGRKPHSREELKAAGTFEKGKHDRPHLSPALLQTVPDPPGNLPKICWPDWYRVCGLLITNKVLTVFDLDAVEMYVSLLAMKKQAQTTLDKDGPTIVYETRHGRTHKPHPAFKVLLETSRELRALGEKMGFDPYSRQRLKIDLEKDKPDPVADLLKQMNEGSRKS